jgi:hypothetical protein
VQVLLVALVQRLDLAKLLAELLTDGVEPAEPGAHQANCVCLGQPRRCYVQRAAARSAGASATSGGPAPLGMEP